MELVATFELREVADDLVSHRAWRLKEKKKINICIIPTENYIEYDKAHNLHINIMGGINGIGFYLVFIVKGIMSALGMLYICLLDQRLKITIHREGSSTTVSTLYMGHMS